MYRFFTWLAQLFRDQRGEIGDIDPADDSPDKDKVDQEDVESDEEEDPDELLIDLDEKEDEEEKEDKDKDKDKSEASKMTEQIKSLKGDLAKLREDKSDLKTALHQARQEKKKPEIGKDEKPLTDTQLAKLLDDANTEGDTQVQLNVLKYLAQQISQGEVKKGVNAAEMSRKAGDFTKVLEDKFPDIANPASDMRTDIDRTKDQLGIVDHPFGDMFAVGYRLFEDMDDLLEASFEAGREETLKGTADENRKKEIKAKSLPSSVRSAYKKTHGLTASQIETATQMGLNQEQLPAYAKLVGKKPRTVSVEG